MTKLNRSLIFCGMICGCFGAFTAQVAAQMQVEHSPYNDAITAVNESAQKVFSSPDGKKDHAAELLSAIEQATPLVKSAIERPGSETNMPAYAKLLQTSPKASDQVRRLHREQLEMYRIFGIALNDPTVMQSLGADQKRGGQPAEEATIDLAAAHWLNAYQDPQAQLSVVGELRAAIAAASHKPTVQLWWDLWTQNQAASEPVASKWLDSLRTYSGVMEGPRLTALVQIKLKHFQMADKPLTIEGTTMTGGHVSTAAWKGKVVLVVGSYSTCQRDFLPTFQQFLDKHQSEGLEIVGLAYDMTLAAAREHLAAFPECKYPMIYQPAQPSSALGCVSLGSFKYGTNAIGASMVIDRMGVMHYLEKPVDVDAVETELAKYLAVQQ